MTMKFKDIQTIEQLTSRIVENNGKRQLSTGNQYKHIKHLFSNTPQFNTQKPVAVCYSAGIGNGEKYADLYLIGEENKKEELTMKEQNTEKKPNGAGPPKQMDGGKVISFYLDEETLKFIKEYGAGNISKGVRDIIKKVRTQEV